MNKLKTIKKIYIFVETILGHLKPLSTKKYMKIYSSTDNRYIKLKTAFRRIFPKKDRIIILNNLKLNSKYGTSIGKNTEHTIRSKTTKRQSIYTDQTRQPGQNCNR